MIYQSTIWVIGALFTLGMSNDEDTEGFWKSILTVIKMIFLWPMYLGDMIRQVVLK